jgi:hypothetical protein
MNPYFLFPADPLNHRVIDCDFQLQAKALTDAGYGYAILNLEDDSVWSPRGGLVAQTPFKQDNIVYRGWMLNEHEYDRMEELADWYGGTLRTTKEQYYQTHHIPNWHVMLSDMTAETLVFPKETIDFDDTDELWDRFFERNLKRTGWRECFVKDYVKSLKTAGGSMVRSAADLRRVVEEMAKFRGTIEGGLCIRQFEEYIPQTEVRFFVVNGKVFAPKIDTNFNIVANTSYLPLANEVAHRITAPFFSVDIATRADFTPRVVECGDGQVSDLVGWTPEEFAQIWA